MITGVAAAVNVALNLTLIPPYGMMGAAIATVAAYTVMFVGMAWWAQRVFPVPLPVAARRSLPPQSASRLRRWASSSAPGFPSASP